MILQLFKFCENLDLVHAPVVTHYVCYCWLSWSPGFWKEITVSNGPLYSIKVLYFQKIMSDYPKKSDSYLCGLVTDEQQTRVVAVSVEGTGVMSCGFRRD